MSLKTTYEIKFQVQQCKWNSWLQTWNLWVAWVKFSLSIVGVLEFSTSMSPIQLNMLMQLYFLNVYRKHQHFHLNSFKKWISISSYFPVIKNACSPYSVILIVSGAFNKKKCSKLLLHKWKCQIFLNCFEIWLFPRI